MTAAALITAAVAAPASPDASRTLAPSRSANPAAWSSALAEADVASTAAKTTPASTKPASTKPAAPRKHTDPSQPGLSPFAAMLLNAATPASAPAYAPASPGTSRVVSRVANPPVAGAIGAKEQTVSPGTGTPAAPGKTPAELTAPDATPLSPPAVVATPTTAPNAPAAPDTSTQAQSPAPQANMAHGSLATPAAASIAPSPQAIPAVRTSATTLSTPSPTPQAPASPSAFTAATTLRPAATPPPPLAAGVTLAPRPVAPEDKKSTASITPATTAPATAGSTPSIAPTQPVFAAQPALAPTATSPAAPVSAATPVTPATILTPATPAALAATVTAMHHASQTTAVLRLDPPGLGNLSVHVALGQNGQVNVLFVPSTPQTVQLLNAGLDALRQAMAATGLTLGQAGVSGGGARNPGQNSASNQRGTSSTPAPIAAPTATVVLPASGVSAYA